MNYLHCLSLYMNTESISTFSFISRNETCLECLTLKLFCNWSLNFFAFEKGCVGQSNEIALRKIQANWGSVENPVQFSVEMCFLQIRSFIFICKYRVCKATGPKLSRSRECRKRTSDRRSFVKLLSRFRLWIVSSVFVSLNVLFVCNNCQNSIILWPYVKLFTKTQATVSWCQVKRRLNQHLPIYIYMCVRVCVYSQVISYKMSKSSGKFIQILKMVRKKNLQCTKKNVKNRCKYVYFFNQKLGETCSGLFVTTLTK